VAGDEIARAQEKDWQQDQQHGLADQPEQVPSRALVQHRR